MARPRFTTPAKVKLKSAPLSRPPLARMLQLHHELTGRNFPNCRKLAEKLEVSPKTIQRDIDFMRDQMGLPIEYDQLHLGFIYTEPVTSFPSIEVSESEVVALFVAQKAMEQYRGTPFEKPLKAAFTKISDGLRDTISFGFDEIGSAVSFKGIGASVADIDLFETVSKAVLHSHELSFAYKKLEGVKYESRRVQPYHLGCVENQWYLFGYDLARRQIRTFALPRMREVRITGAGFRRPADFSIAEHLSGSWGVFTGDQKRRVTVRFDAFAGRLVGERRWHPSQKIKTLPGGGIELTITIDGLLEIERWILCWGLHARVIEPKDLVTRMRETAESLSGIYAKQT
jgi:proteasome accessory factor B